MNLRKVARFSGVALTAAMSGAILVQPAVAHKDNIERNLAGIRINASAKTVLSLFGNPNDIQIGDTPVRPPSNAGAGTGQQGGMLGQGGGMMGGGMMGMDGGGMMGGGGGKQSPGANGMASMGGGGGSMMGSMGGPMGGGMSGSMGGPMGSGSMGGPLGGGGLDGPGGGGGFPGGGQGGSGIGGFGQTQSSSTVQQELTWVYNAKARDAKNQMQAISYEFLISPEGKVSQIRVIGYVPKTKNDKSAKGLTLGSTYMDLIKSYGSPKSVMKSGELLVCSYPERHIEFQLMNMRSVNGYADPYKGIFKVVAIQVNTTE